MSGHVRIYGVRFEYDSETQPLSAAVLARAAQLRHAKREIVIAFERPPIPARDCDWSAIDRQTYDGAPDSGNRHQVGRGATAEAALAELLDMLEDEAADCAAAEEPQ